jgi:hypothetical protein
MAVRHDPSLKPRGNNAEEEDRWTCESFSVLLIDWIDDSGVKCRAQWVTVTPFDSSKAETFGTGDKDRFIKKVRAVATRLRPGNRVLIRWVLSPVGNHCVDMIFEAERDPTSV